MIPARAHLLNNSTERALIIMKKNKIPVTVRALVQRVNRKLVHDGEKLHNTRKRKPLFYVVNRRHNCVVSHIDDAAGLETFARELGVLAEWERLQ
jgi:hypothetical protein